MMKKEPIKSEVFSFRTTDEKTIKALNAENVSDALSAILKDYYDGKLIHIDEAIKKKEMAELKFRDYKARIIVKELNAKVQMIRGMNVSPEETAQVMNNKKSIYEVKAKKDIIQIDNSLRCFTCGKLIEMRAYDFQQVEDYEKHVKELHQRELYQNERESMLIVLGEVSNESN
jgi:DNA-directed RNA polymerase subunit N (RpoN/RPB10)